LQIIPNSEKKNLDFKIIDNAKAINVGEGTIRRGAATCPICGFTTNVTSVRKQLKIRNGGTADSLLYTIVTTHSGKKGRFYRLPKESDFDAIEKASKELNLRILAHKKSLSLVPDELIPTTSSGFLAPPTYGMDRFDLLFTPRQSLTLAIFSQLVSNVGDKLATEYDNNAAIAIQTCLALVFDRLADKLSSLARWDKSRDHFLVLEEIGILL
jgi:adenine-specific DNA methylase